MKKKYIGLKPFNNKIYYQNNILNSSSVAASPYLIAARKLLATKNIIMNTIDVHTEFLTEKDVYFDIPYPWEVGYWMRIFKNRKKNILFIVEPPIVNPFSHMKFFHKFFSIIYTWNDSLLDNKKYFKFNIPKTRIEIETKEVLFTDKKLLILMNGNWLPFLLFQILSLSTKEFYTERIKAIEFFNTNCSEEFSLYGRGWNKPQRFSLMQRIFGYKKYKSYKGEFDSGDKYKILSRFKFCLCFENSRITGYISEKIFDCFKAKCVPIYRGAPNIDKFIPQNCYIDIGKFKNYSDLYNYLMHMTEAEYNNYILNIKYLMEDEKFLSKWSKKEFAKLFLQAITTK